MNLDHLTKEQREDVETILHITEYELSAAHQSTANSALDRLVSAITRHEPTGKELVGKFAMVKDHAECEWSGPRMITAYIVENGFPYRTGFPGWRFARALTTEEREAALKALEV